MTPAQAAELRMALDGLVYPSVPVSSILRVLDEQGWRLVRDPGR